MKSNAFHPGKTGMFLAVLCLSFIYLNAQEKNPVLEKINTSLQESGKVLPVEKIYIQTDKEIYAPGEIVWFSAWIYDVSFNRLSSFSQEMIVSLYDQNGNFVTGDKYLVRDGKVDADLLVPADISLGRYYLAAYSSVQAEARKVAVKPLRVFRYYESDVQVAFTDPAKIHRAGSSSAVELTVSEANGNPADKFMLNYEMKSGKKVIGDGRVRSVSGKAVIPVQIPEKGGNEPLTLSVSHPKNLWTKQLFLKTSADAIHIRFYAEGGNLLNGMPQKIGYYATNQNGSPVDLEADITDAGGMLIAKTKTFHPGFGIFPYKAVTGTTHRLVITSEYGKGQTFELPSPGTGQLTLIVTKTDNESVTSDILFSGNTPQKLVLTATSGYTLLWAASLEISGTSRMKIPVKELGTGVILLSIFDNNIKLLSSRLIYIPEKKKMDVKIQTDTSEKDRVKITAETFDDRQQPVAAELILSVTDKMRQEDTGNSLAGFLTHISELKNTVTYSGKELEETLLSGPAIDYFMICNELKSFSWDQVLQMDTQKVEQELLKTIGISGTACDKKGNPVPGAKVGLMNNRDMKLYTATADNKGKFIIPGVIPVNVYDYNSSVTDASGKGNYQAIFDKTLSEKVGELVKRWDYAFADSKSGIAGASGYLAANPGLLESPPVVKPVSSGDVRPWSDSYKSLLLTATSLIDVIRSMKPFTMVNGQIVFYGTINSFNAQSGALIVIDGQKIGTQADVLNSIAPFDVERINISLDPMEIQRYTGLNNVGIIEIFTKRGEIPSSADASKPVEKLYENGYRIPRQFLTPKSLESKSGKDMRTTLYWNANLDTGPAGKVVFSIPLSAIKSDFMIKAEGISSSGLEGQQRVEFSNK